VVSNKPPIDLKNRKFLLQLGLVPVIMLAMSLNGTFPSTERIAVAFIFAFIWTANGRAFLVEFAPFLMLLVAYKQARNFADDFSRSEINVENLIEWERALFGGTLPSVVVQEQMWDRWYTPILDVITNALYLSHFLSPLVLAVFLWQRARRLYWSYAVGLVVLSYVAFAVYVLFPAAPPWWATMYGYLPDDPILLDHFAVSADTVAKGANPVAAMPSLHAAYPTYIALVAIAVWGRKALPVIALPLAVVFATVYLGHHYLIDALAGALLSLAAFAAIFLPLDRWINARRAVPATVAVEPAPATADKRPSAQPRT